jgi:hypothetical protein
MKCFQFIILLKLRYHRQLQYHQRDHQRHHQQHHQQHHQRHHQLIQLVEQLLQLSSLIH